MDRKEARASFPGPGHPVARGKPSSHRSAAGAARERAQTKHPGGAHPSGGISGFNRLPFSTARARDEVVARAGQPRCRRCPEETSQTTTTTTCRSPAGGPAERHCLRGSQYFHTSRGPYTTQHTTIAGRLTRIHRTAQNVMHGLAPSKNKNYLYMYIHLWKAGTLASSPRVVCTRRGTT